MLIFLRDAHGSKTISPSPKLLHDKLYSSGRTVNRDELMEKFAPSGSVEEHIFIQFRDASSYSTIQ